MLIWCLHNCEQIPKFIKTIRLKSVKYKVCKQYLDKEKKASFSYYPENKNVTYKNLQTIAKVFISNINNKN